jgi:ankyrin repeat protein
MASAAAGHEGIVRLLLEKGANARETHFREGSALILAIRNGHERVVQCLIEAGVNVDEGDAKGPSTISIAAFCGQGAIVKMLLMAGAQCSEFTIQSAAQNSHESIVELLRTHLNGPNAIDHDVSRSVSARSGPEDEQTLVRPKSVSLWSAAAGGLESEVRRLLDCGTDPDSYKFLQRGTALSLAAGNGHASIVELLLQRGADINLQPTSRTLSPLDAAAKRGHLTVVRNLLCAQPPASTVVKAEFCGNPLESAAYSGNIAVLREILECKADVNAICAEDRFGGTALTAAARIGHEGMVELLLDQGAE